MGWDKNSGEDLLKYLYDIHNIKEVLLFLWLNGQYGNKIGYQV